MFLNWIYKSKDNYLFTLYGVKDKDYKIENGRLKLINTDTLFYEWMFSNINFLMQRDAAEEGAAAGFTNVYVPRFDWSSGKIRIKPDQSDTLGCQQWLSPPPFCYAFEVENEWVSCGLAVRPGEYNFLNCDYNGGSTFYLTLTYEAHTLINGEFETPRLVFGFGEKEENASVKAYIQ